MNTLLDELIETFDRLSVVYEELLKIAKSKQHCLISGSIEELETLIYQEKNKTEIVQLLEEKRQYIVARYCKEHNVQGNNITLKCLINKMDTVHSEKICNLIDKLTRALKQLQEVNQTNTTLIHYSLEITEDMIKIFCPSALQYSIYGYTGKMHENEFPMVLMDTEI
ncbi:MAG: hypothetical protein QG591_715 [Planctomycetota bacterium]|jgi:flagellar biosynthesis/type III secretory pathway chaperone|nr:hypothetical protein [Planctomycetota bacterium]